MGHVDIPSPTCADLNDSMISTTISKPPTAVVDASALNRGNADYVTPRDAASQRSIEPLSPEPATSVTIVPEPQAGVASREILTAAPPPEIVVAPSIKGPVLEPLGPSSSGNLEGIIAPNFTRSTSLGPTGTATTSAPADHEQRIRIVHHWEKHVKEIKMKKGEDLDNLLRLVREVIKKLEVQRTECAQKLASVQAQISEFNSNPSAQATQSVETRSAVTSPSSPRHFEALPSPSSITDFAGASSNSPYAKTFATPAKLPGVQRTLNLGPDACPAPAVRNPPGVASQPGILAAATIPENREGILIDNLDVKESGEEASSAPHVALPSRAVSSASFDDSINSPCPTPFTAFEAPNLAKFSSVLTQADDSVVQPTTAASADPTSAPSAGAPNPRAFATTPTASQSNSNTAATQQKPSELTQAYARYEKQLKELETSLSKYKQVEDVLVMRPEGCKVQLKPRKITFQGRVRQALLVCKWGGGMTHAGHLQAMQYANAFWNDICPPPVPLPEFVTSLAIDRGGVLVKAEGGLYEGSDDETESISGASVSNASLYGIPGPQQSTQPAQPPRVASQPVSVPTGMENKSPLLKGESLPVSSSYPEPHSLTPTQVASTVGLDAANLTYTSRGPRPPPAQSRLPPVETQDNRETSKQNVDDALKASFYAPEKGPHFQVSRQPDAQYEPSSALDDIPTDAEADAQRTLQHTNSAPPMPASPDLDAEPVVPEGKVYDNPADTRDPSLATAATERAATGRMTLYEDYFNAQLAVSLSDPLGGEDAEGGGGDLEEEFVAEDEDEDEDCAIPTEKSSSDEIQTHDINNLDDSILELQDSPAEDSEKRHIGRRDYLSQSVEASQNSQNKPRSKAKRSARRSVRAKLQQKQPQDLDSLPTPDGLDDEEDHISKAHAMLSDAHPDLEAPLAYSAYDFNATIGQHEGEQIRSYFAKRPKAKGQTGNQSTGVPDSANMGAATAQMTLPAQPSSGPILPQQPMSLPNGLVLPSAQSTSVTLGSQGPTSSPPGGRAVLHSLFEPLQAGTSIDNELPSQAHIPTLPLTSPPSMSCNPDQGTAGNAREITFVKCMPPSLHPDEVTSASSTPGDAIGLGHGHTAGSVTSSGSGLTLTRSSSGALMRDSQDGSVRTRSTLTHSGESASGVQTLPAGPGMAAQTAASKRKWNRKWNQQHMDKLQALFEQQRLNFIKDMEVFASDEPRVQASARAFYIATFEHAYKLSPPGKRTPEEQALAREIRKRADEKCHITPDVLSYLDDISAAAKDMHRSKQGVKSMLLSTVRWTEEQVSKYMIYLEKISKAVTEEEKAQLRKEKDAHLREAQLLNERMRQEKEEEERIRRKEEEELERAARELDEKAAEEEETTAIILADTLEAEMAKAMKKKKKNKGKQEPLGPIVGSGASLASSAVVTASVPSSTTTSSGTTTTSTTSTDSSLPPELRMTSWAARCLRWLGIPREQLVKLLELMRGLLDRIRQLRQKRAAQESGQGSQAGGTPAVRAAGEQADNPDEVDEYVFEDGDEEVVGQGAKIKAPAGKEEAEKLNQPCNGETLELMEARWAKLINDFYDASRDQFDPTKIPDVHDAIKYDALHNYAILHGIRPLYQASRKLADFVVPNEYGILSKDKLRIGRLITHKLLDKIIENLERAKSDATDIPRVFLYFSSESHIHGLRNTMLLSDMPDNKTAATTLEALELNYLSHGVWRLFEDLSQPVDSPDRFVVNFMFSPGAALDPFIFAEEGHLLPVSRPIPITARIPFDEFKRRFFHLGDKLATDPPTNPASAAAPQVPAADASATAPNSPLPATSSTPPQ